MLINPKDHRLSVDVESFSEVDLRSSGAWKYWESSSAEILLFGYSLDKAPVQIIDITSESLPPRIIDALKSPDVTLHGWNVVFEWLGLSKHLNHELPIEKLRDTMLHSAYLGFPLSLDAAGPAVGLEQDKQKDRRGTALINFFSKPRKPTKNNPSTRNRPSDDPVRWAEYIEYNAQDVRTEMAIEEKLSPWPVPEKLQKEWELTLRQNHRGVGVDMDLMRGALRCYETATERLTAEAKAITSLDNPNSVQQLSGWLSNEMKVPIEGLAKQDVKNYLDLAGNTEKSRRVLEIRQELGKSSVKKFHAMENTVCEDERIHGVTQFFGAHTGRAAGRLIQTQNFPRSSVKQEALARKIVKSGDADMLALLFGSVPDTLASLLRSALIPAPGNLLAAADLASIESRVIAWLAGEEWVLEVFRTHGKIYESVAAMMFNVPFESIDKGSSLRQQGKVSTLALGYQGGVGALTAMDYNNDIPDEDKPDLVQRWRNANPNIVKFWYAVDRAMKDTVRTGRTNNVGYITFRFEASGNLSFLTAEMPDGSKMFYPQPHFAPGSFDKEGLFYYGIHQQTRKWAPVQTYGGRAVENFCQKVARHVIYDKITALEEAGLPVVFSVHDEAVVDVRWDGDPAELAAKMESILCEPLEWAPGLPLGAEAWAGAWYRK